MEGNIKLLKSLLIHAESTLLDDEAMALENLIKGYRELEEENNKFRNGEIVTPKSEAKVRETVFNNFKNDLKNYISKSKVKEKIEELDKQRIKMEKDDVGVGFTLGKKWSDSKAKIQVLQELMED